MTVGDLKEMLADASDDMPVLISLAGDFDGMFVSPCMKESGISEAAIYEYEEDEEEALLLGKEITRTDFILVRCGFFIEHDGPDPEEN